MVFLDLSEYFASSVNKSRRTGGLWDEGPSSRSARSSLIFMNYVCDMHYWFSHLL